MSEEKLFDVNWDQRKWETPASAQDMKLYSLSTENDTEYVSSGISDMAGAVAGIDWRTSVYCMDDSDWRL